LVSAGIAKVRTASSPLGSIGVPAVTPASVDIALTSFRMDSPSRRLAIADHRRRSNPLLTPFLVSIGRSSSGAASERQQVLGEHRRDAVAGPVRRRAMGRDHRVQSSETMVDLAAIRLVLNRLAPA